MDLDTANRINLIQRNLESAQVAIDSAVELLRVVMENGFRIPDQAPQQTIISRAEPVFAAALPAPKKKLGRPKKRAHGNVSTKAVKSTGPRGRGLGPSPATLAILGVFKSHPDKTYDYPTLDDQLRAKGTVIDRQKIRDACNNLAMRGSLERITAGQFKYKTAA